MTIDYPSLSRLASDAARGLLTYDGFDTGVAQAQGLAAGIQLCQVLSRLYTHPVAPNPPKFASQPTAGRDEPFIRSAVGTLTEELPTDFVQRLAAQADDLLPRLHTLVGLNGQPDQTEVLALIDTFTTFANVLRAYNF